MKQSDPVPRIVLSDPGTQDASTVDGKSKSNRALLGSDLVAPARSEFKLKTKLDPADRGRPMVDWIRRQAVQDSGNYSKPIPSNVALHIDEDMLADHCTQKDAWIALRGQVFDVSDYIRYHPGGVNQIMKGVGIDGTALFNKVHRYVNFESILKGKQVGVYSPNRRGSSAAAKGRDLVVTNIKSKEEGVEIGHSCFGSHAPQDFDELLIPSTKFREDQFYCYYTINLKTIKYTESYWTAAILQKERLLLKVVISPPEMWVGYYKLKEALLNDKIQVYFSNRFRTMTVEFTKPRELTWNSIGDPLPDSNLILDSRFSIDDRNPCVITLSNMLARDMYMFGIEISPSAKVGVPVGFDVKLTALQEGETVSRRYTPIPLFFHGYKYHHTTTSGMLYFLIKIYPNGKLTQILKSLPLETPDLLEVGFTCGNFNTDWLHGADTFFLFSAGSGITPFISILQFYLDHNIALGVSHVVLCHWVKEKEDLVWQENFELLVSRKKWFDYVPILTQVPEEDQSWGGLRGRISDMLLDSILKTVPPEAIVKKSKVRFMTCGPEGFNCAVCETIDHAGYPLNSTFVFLG